MGQGHALPAGQHLGHFLHREAGSVRVDYRILWGPLGCAQLTSEREELPHFCLRKRGTVSLRTLEQEAA